MDRISRAANRLWGGLGKDGRLHSSPRFIDELSQCCNANLGCCETRVSKWSYGHQLEHLYRSTHYVLDRLEEAMTGRNASERMGFWGAGMMVGGFIPRYWFPTIPQLVPESGTMEHIGPLRDELKARVERINWTLDEIKACPGKSKHPRMKYLTASQWLFFGDIHHRHHLSLIRDIVKAAGVSRSSEIIERYEQKESVR